MIPLALSKTQIKRQKYDYRYYYFKKNPGLFGAIWFCSQCHKILIGKKNVQVDHIWALGAGGINRTINTAAICRKCNSRKSDKTGLWLINGILGKIIELIIFKTRDAIKFSFTLITDIIKLSLSLFGKMACIVLIVAVAMLVYNLFFK